MKSSVYFPLEKLKPTDIHKVEVFNALFQAYSECENHCSGNKDWGHLVRVASDHKLCKRYGIRMHSVRMHSDSYDTYPVFNDLYGDIDCFGFANDWDWRTHSVMHYTFSNPEGFKESPYFKDPDSKTIFENKNEDLKSFVDPDSKTAFENKNEDLKSFVSEQMPVKEVDAQSRNLTAVLTGIILILLIIIFFLL